MMVVQIVCMEYVLEKGGLKNGLPEMGILASRL